MEILDDVLETVKLVFEKFKQNLGAIMLCEGVLVLVYISLWWLGQKYAVWSSSWYTPLAILIAFLIPFFVIKNKQ